MQVKAKCGHFINCVNFTPTQEHITNIESGPCPSCWFKMTPEEQKEYTDKYLMKKLK